MTQQAPTQGRALVPADEAQELVDDPTVRFVEVDVDTARYEKGHVPGAAAFDWNEDLQDPVRRDVATREDLTQLLRDAGVTEDTSILLYGDNHNWFAAYAYWLLLHRGFPQEQVALVDGGRTAIEQAGFRLTTDTPEFETTGFTLGEPRPELRALREDVLPVAEGDEERPLVDVRSPEEFRGDIVAPPGLDETAQRGGHIPGASNVPWSQAVNDEDGTFKSPAELEELYGDAGITPDQETIVYCRIGERSSHTWFALTQVLDWPATNYDGSWTEYGNLVDVPVETGD